MLTNLLTPILNYILYSLSFLFPITFRSVNSFNGLFSENSTNINFIQLMTSFWLVVCSLYLLYTHHKTELKWEYAFIFKYKQKYSKFNRFIIASLIGCIPLVLIDIFKVYLFTKYDYLIFLISLLLIVLIFVIMFTFSEKPKYQATKKVRSMSWFDFITVTIFILLFNIIGTISCISLVLIYLFLNNYNLRSISFVSLFLTFVINLIYFATNFLAFKAFNIWLFFESFIVVVLIALIYFLIFKTTNNQKKWISSILFVFSLYIYILYL